jgi:hypothetical protein
MIARTKKRLLQIGNILAVIITILINVIAVILPLNGKTTQELSDNLPNLFVPAGLTFSIWGIIYILWIIFAIYQARDLFKKEEIDMPFLQKITFLFILSSIANSAWIFLWHYEYVGLSLLMMIILLVSLLTIYTRLNIGRSIGSMAERLCIHVPFSVYLVATLLTILMLALRKDIAFSLVVLWAFFGIWMKRTTLPNTTIDVNVATTITIAIIFIVIGILAVIGYRMISKNK